MTQNCSPAPNSKGCGDESQSTARFSPCWWKAVPGKCRSVAWKRQMGQPKELRCPPRAGAGGAAAVRSAATMWSAVAIAAAGRLVPPHQRSVLLPSVWSVCPEIKPASTGVRNSAEKALVIAQILRKRYSVILKEKSYVYYIIKRILGCGNLCPSGAGQKAQGLQLGFRGQEQHWRQRSELCQRCLRVRGYSQGLG